MANTIEIFFCYAREDEELRKGLEKQLRSLKRQGIINVWHDREIIVGTEWEREIDKHLNSAHIILLLISPDFMDSDYCYSKEMKRAMERHELGEAKVIPIILRPVYWLDAPFGKIQALPTDAKAIMSRYWYNLDEAFFDVAEGIRRAVAELVKSLEAISQPQYPSLSESIISMLPTSETEAIIADSVKSLDQQKITDVIEEANEKEVEVEQVIFNPLLVQVSQVQDNLELSLDTKELTDNVITKKNIDQIIHMSSNELISYLRLLRSSGTVEQINKAINAVAKWLTGNSQDITVWSSFLELIRLNGTPEQVTRAINNTEDWLTHNPQDFEIRGLYLELARQKGTKKQITRAINMTAAWLTANPQDFEVRSLYLESVRQKGTPEQNAIAINATTAWLSANPQDTKVRSSYLELIRLKGTPEQIARAIETVEVWLSANPEDIKVRSAYLELISQIGTPEQVAKAIETTQIRVTSNFQDTKIFISYFELIAERGTAEHLAFSYKFLNNWFDLNPGTSNGKLMYYYGKIMFRLELYEEAEKQLLNSLKINGTFILARVTLAWCLYYQNKKEQALKELQYIKQRAEDGKGYPLGAAFHHLGHYYLLEGDLPNAVSSFQKAISESPDHFGNYLELGKALLAQRQNSLALNAFKAAQKRLPFYISKEVRIELAESIQLLTG